MVEIPDKAIKYPMQLRFIDTDQAGHVNHAVFVTYLETARIEWIKEFGGNNDFKSIPIIIAKVDIDYIAPILLTDTPVVSIWVSRIGSKSYDYSYVIHGQRKGEQVYFAKAKTIQVYFDYKNQKSIVIPEKERELLQIQLAN